MASNDLFAIWGRIIDSSWAKLSPNEARGILKLKLKQSDRERVNELSERARDGLISGREREELAQYLYVGRVLTLMHSEARRALKAAEATGTARRRKAS